MQAAQQALDRRLGVVLHEPHVGGYRFGSNFAFQLPQLPLAQRVGSDLGGEVGQVLLRVARRLCVARQPFAYLVIQ